MTSPSNILQRLQELRNWQQNSEDLLRKVSSLTKSPQSGGNNQTTVSDYQSIDGLSQFDSTIESPQKSFREFEAPLIMDMEMKPKRPFLKKGSGLERYKIKLKTIKKPSGRSQNEEKIEKSDLTPLRVPDLVIKPRATWTTIVETPNQLGNQSRMTEIPPREATPEPGEQTLYEKNLEKELRLFEALELKVQNSSFSSTNSSVLKLLGQSPIKSAVKKCDGIVDKDDEKRVTFDDDDDENENLLAKRPILAGILERLQRMTQRDSSTPVQESDEDKWSITDSSVSSADCDRTLKIDVGVGTNDGCDDEKPEKTVTDVDLKQKMAEYTKKIEEIENEKPKLDQVKRDFQQRRQTLERNVEKKKRELEEEHENRLKDLETERRKLIKEKSAFQSQVKEAQNRPTKREREEITKLKRELADLKETIKLKESKNGMTQARLRNQLKQMEKDNALLRDEVDKLTKENSKLSAVQKMGRKSSETKILHEINKNVTKLAQENLKNQRVEIVDDRQNGNRESKSRNDEVKERRISDDPDDSLLNFTNFRNVEGVGNNLERQYGDMLIQNPVMNDSRKLGKVEKLLEDGSKEITYSNGNVKKVSPDGNQVVVKYYNGDMKETSLLSGTIKYFYKEHNIWQTNLPDGTEIVEFNEGHTEKRYSNGKCEVFFPDGLKQTIFPDKTQEIHYQDGSVLRILGDNEKILLLPNGQKEFQTADHKRREYPDGTVKILYPDGAQETRYANGRVRIKDANGTLVMDSYG